MSLSLSLSRVTRPCKNLPSLPSFLVLESLDVEQFLKNVSKRVEEAGQSSTFRKLIPTKGRSKLSVRSRKGNARYLDLLCADTIWKRGREKVESSHWLIFVLFIRRSFPRVFFFSFFPPFLRERENRGSGLRFEAFFLPSSSFFLLLLLSSPVVLSLRLGQIQTLQAILMAEIMIEHYGNGI